MPSEPSRGWQWVLTVGLDLALVGALVAVPTASFVVLDPIPEPVPPPPLPDLGLIQAACAPLGHPDKMECYLAALRPVLLTHGVAEAFGLLESLRLMDPYVAHNDHPMAHSLGRDAYEFLRNEPAILLECPFTMFSGCIHGSIEAYLTSEDEVTAADIQGLCVPVNEERGRFGYYQCLHGLGHGLTIFLGHDLLLALEWCDLLGGDWERQSCWGAVFMENIVSFQVATGLGVGEGLVPHIHEGEEPTNGTLRPADPYWPCDAVEGQYRDQCWGIQTTAMLTLNYWNWGATFELCLGAETAYIPTCFHSMGRDISGAMLRSPGPTVDMCSMADDRFEQHCIEGAAKDVVTNFGDGDPAFPLCATVKPEHKEICYFSIGEVLIPLLGDEGARRTECAQAEPEWVGTCRLGARV